ILDTLPGYPQATDIEDVRAVVYAYLRLAEHRLHLPLVYDLVTDEAHPAEHPIVLLEEAAIWQPGQVIGRGDGAVSSGFTGVLLLPSILDLWTRVSGRRQLFWLWQVTSLWSSLLSEEVATTLLTPDLIRVEGGLLRLLELRLDLPDTPPTLADLGALWQSWLTKADPDIADFLQSLCTGMVDGALSDAEQVLAELDAQLAQFHGAMPHTVRMTTRTDQGPTRSRNEDACYPKEGTVATDVLHSDAADHTLVVVCDGIGGHQGGDVASHLAIASLEHHLHTFPLPTLDPSKLSHALIESIGIANDQISQRNDSEMRMERQRMGTTLVLSLLRHHELYLAHVGDSRAYWITRWGCHQATLDDDVASRQMRLGYALHRQALRHPNSGSLVQALGMGPSNLLHPTVRRFLLDEDGVILLCSDGLSDGDRVEEHWDTELLPLLKGAGDFATLGHHLIEIANTQNGHDNVTVGIIHHQLPVAEDDQQIILQHMQALAEDYQATVHGRAIAAPSATTPTAATVVAEPAQPSRRSISFIPLLLILLLGSALVIFLVPPLRDRVLPLLSETTPEAPPLSPTPTPGAIASPTPILPGNLIQIGRTPEGATPLLLLSQPDPAKLDGLTLISGSILRVLDRPEEIDVPWLRVVVCSVGETSVGEAPAPTDDAILDSTELPTDPTLPAPEPTTLPSNQVAQVGNEGWLPEDAVVPLAMPVAEEVVPSNICPPATDPTTNPDSSLEGDPLG
ncbi:MAG: protein phosphatase 2C domain-containing protein, partial [Cyanobacteria bacterium J06638_22]